MKDKNLVSLGKNQLNNLANQVCIKILEDHKFMMSSKMQEDQPKPQVYNIFQVNKHQFGQLFTNGASKKA